MKKSIILFLFILVKCNKNINRLVTKNKTGGEYWQFIKEDRKEELKKYLEDNKNIDINKKMNEGGEIALTLAVRCNSKKIINFLLNDDSIKEKINVNARNRDEKTALIASILDSSKCLKRNLIIKKLLNNGADVNIRYGAGCNALMLAIMEGDTYILKEILNKNAKINAQNLFGETALILAIKANIDEEKRINIINGLLQHNEIDINLQDRQGRIALTYAVIKNDFNIAKLLINRKDIDINIIDKKNMTPFDHLIFSDFDIELVLSLIRKGATLNNKEYLYSKSRKENLEEIMDLLIEGKGDMHYVKGNKNLLHWSITLFDNNIDMSLRLSKYLIKTMKIDSNSIEKYIKYAVKRGTDLFYLMMITYKGKEEDIYSLIKENIGEIKDEKEKIKKIFFHAIQNGSLDTIKNLLKKEKNINFKDEFDTTPLMYAIEYQRMDVIKLLLQKGANINERNKNSDTALIIAVRQGNKVVVELLIKENADVNAKDDRGYTPLMLAITKNYKEIVKILIESNVNFNDSDVGGSTALMYAAENGHIDIVKLLLEKKGANINAKNLMGFTALMYAAGNGYANIVNLLLEKGADISAKDLMGYTALMHAVEDGYEEVVKSLLEKEGANIDDKDGDGKTLLMYAAENGHTDIVKLLLEKGANISCEDGEKSTALMYAILKKKEEIINLLKEKGATLPKRNNKSNENFLLLACINGDIESAKSLIEKGANVNEIDEDGKVPLVCAAKYGHVNIVKLLLEKGANINYEDEEKSTALIYAAENGYEEVVKLLLEKGVNINNKDKYDETPLMYAAENGYKEVVKLLLEEGADISAKDLIGYTALIYAAENGYEEVVKLLLEKEANTNISIKDSMGFTALMHAAEKGYKNIVKLILKKENESAYMDHIKIINDIKTILIGATRKIKINLTYSKIYLTIAKCVLDKMIIDNIILYKSLDKSDLKNTGDLKEEINKRIELLRLLCLLPPELLESVMKYL